MATHYLNFSNCGGKEDMNYSYFFANIKGKKIQNIDAIKTHYY